ncbi:MAG TPA: biotin--[acetyl-CoA-carboxylase] ligase [Bacteroidales bacterium]|nr:biotin--[acetyl-CoA-carboxylase] ligase [Bacteroidales bacterium]HPT02247.1 biotin--[acetyl-CoA-carboxylase] ligase [Bacteroidales bacterium]
MRIIGSSIISLDESASTNDYALELLKSSKPADGTVVTTKKQSAGRGQENNSWESEPGKNLTLSIILYPHFLPPDRQSLLSMAIALGVYDLINSHITAQPVRIKWPNDIYIGDRKACGMLIQNSIMGNRFDYAIAGIGLNVNQEKFISDAPNPVSLKMIAGREFPTEELLWQLCGWLDTRYHQLRLGDRKGISEEYLSLMYRYNEWHVFEIRHRAAEARITGINRYGQLQLEERNGTRSECDMKEVKFLI